MDEATADQTEIASCMAAMLLAFVLPKSMTQNWYLKFWDVGSMYYPIQSFRWQMELGNKSLNAGSVFFFRSASPPNGTRLILFPSPHPHLQCGCGNIPHCVLFRQWDPPPLPLDYTDQGCMGWSSENVPRSQFMKNQWTSHESEWQYMNLQFQVCTPVLPLKKGVPTIPAVSPQA